MTMEVRVPQLPESVADATLVAWHKKVGDSVARDENLADLETDKVVLELPAPAAGVVKSLRARSGRDRHEWPAARRHRRAGRRRARRRSLRRRPMSRKPAEPKKAEPAATPAPAAPRKEESAGKLSPAARRMVEENKLAPAEHRGQRPRRAHHEERRCSSSGGSTASPGCGSGRGPRGPARADVASASPHCATAGGGTGDGRAADDVQRDRHAGADGAARALQGGLREAPRRAPRLHVLLRQGLHRGAPALPRGQCLGRRQRHRLPRVLRHRDGGLDRPRPYRPGAARRRPHGFRGHREGRRPASPSARAAARSRSRNSPAERFRSPMAACSAR